MELRAQMMEGKLLRKLPETAANACNRVIDEWAEADDLPLIVRRNGHPYTCVRLQVPGRSGGVVPSDNSPAHWMVMRCFESEPPPTLKLVRSFLYDIPMTMRMSEKDAQECDFPKRLDDYSDDHAGTSGWYLAHIQPVGLGKIGKTPLERLPVARPKEHFRLLMRPSNMILVARAISGLAEIDGWIA